MHIFIFFRLVESLAEFSSAAYCGRGGGGGGAKLLIWSCDGLLLFLVDVGGLNGGGAFGSFALGFLGLENDPCGVIGGGGGAVLGGIVNPTNFP